MKNHKVVSTSVVLLRKSVSALKYSKAGLLYFVVVVAVPLARHSSAVGETQAQVTSSFCSLKSVFTVV